jgi:Tfp pilus assembly protein PilE
MEVITVLTIIGVLLSMSAPSFSRTVEQAHADIAGANLRAIWSAQRYYWLENRTYADDLEELETLDLLDGSVVTGTSRYSFSITSADDDAFTAAAIRTGSERWNGTLTVDESGSLTGTIQADGQPYITPGLQ